jgi:ketosteroid isomerase-like protein
MVAQKYVALVRSVSDLFNSRQSDPAWLDKGTAAFAADCEIVDVPSGTTFHSPEGYKRSMRFLVEAFPNLRIELINVFATEEQVVFEGTMWWTTTSPLHLPTGDVPATGGPGELRCCSVWQIRRGKIVSVHRYYDLTTLLEQFSFNAATRGDLQAGGELQPRAFCLPYAPFS